MGYYIDLQKISLDEYRHKLETAYLIPSRMILKEKLDERFGYFKNIGVQNIQELQQTLKKKDRFAELVKEKWFSEEYLTVLLRELNSIQPKPNRIADFTGISVETIARLEKAGIKDTLKLYDWVTTPEKRKQLAGQTGISHDEILELTKLTDLSRIKWVGATFARVLYQAGYDTVEKVSKANYQELYEKIHRLNKEQNLYKGQIGLNDMNLLVEVANDVSLEIHY